MNIKELKEILEEYPEDLEVWAFCEGYGNPFPAKREDIKLSWEQHSYGPPEEVLLIGIE